MGAPGGTANGVDSGSLLLFQGNVVGAGGTLGSGQVSTWWFGEAANDRAGERVYGLGDPDGDGYREIAAWSSSLDVLYIIRGKDIALNSPQTSLQLAGYKLTGPPGSGFGVSVAHSGDMDGDGLDDLMIGAPHLNGGDIWDYFNGFP